MTIEPTAKQLELIQAALCGKYRLILYGGAIRGAKTFGVILTYLIAKRKWPGMRGVFTRIDMPTIERNTYPTWEKINPTSVTQDRRADNKNPRIIFNNKSELIFFGENYSKDKELNRWKGLETNWFLADEINELQEASFWKMVERCGSYVIQEGITPPPLILATCNPTQGWVKDLIYNKWKKGELPEDWLYIPAKITDNPHLPVEYIESLKGLPRYEYEVFVEGNWDIQLKTGGEFWKSFELNKHVRPIRYDENATLHITIDNNVYPYIAISVWQVIKFKDITEIRQIHEIPAKDPNNTASASAREFVKWAKTIGYEDVVFIYGDQTTTQRNTIDENKKSFLDKFVSEISKSFPIRKKIPSKNPPVALSGEFINAIYELEYDNNKIIINETCKESINDYILTKQDNDGKILKTRTKDPKTGVSYEEHGHYSDIKRYFITQAFKESFSKFKRRFEPNKDQFTVGGRITDRRF